VVKSCLAADIIDRVIAIVQALEMQDSLDELIEIMGAPTGRG